MPKSSRVNLQEIFVLADFLDLTPCDGFVLPKGRTKTLGCFPGRLSFAAGPCLGLPQPILSSASLLTEPGLTASLSTDSSDPDAFTSEGQRPDPIDFTPEELKELQRRFGVHGPQAPWPSCSPVASINSRP